MKKVWLGYLCLVDILFGLSAAAIADTMPWLLLLQENNPIAVNDMVAMTEDTPAVIEVLANDIKVIPGETAIVSVSQPANGTVVNNSVDLTYQPAPDYCNDIDSTDDFTYTLAPGGSTASVRVLVACVNDPPADITISSASVLEDQPTGTAVGTFSTTDPDGNDSFTYALVSGKGDVDNESFTIVGSELRTAAIFDFESKNSYSIRVRVTDEANSRFEKVFSISIDQLILPDLDIISYYMSPGSPTTTDAIEFTAIVKNIGTVSADASHLSIRVGSETEPPEYSVPALEPGATFTVQRTLTLDVAQWYLSEVIADCDGEVVEDDETNNTDSLTFEVTEAPLPDLAISSYYMSPLTPTTADLIQITAIVQNIGTVPAEASHLSIRVGSETEPPTYSVPALAAGASFTVQRTLTLEIAQWYLSEVIADCDGEVVEDDETNNDDTLIFEVTEAPLPDFSISSYYMSPATPTTTDAILFTAIVKNIGTVSAEASHLSIRVGSETEPPTYSVPALAAGAAYTVQRSLVVGVAQWYLSEVIADCDGEVVEDDETNNKDTLIFEVTEASPSGPDSLE